MSVRVSAGLYYGHVYVVCKSICALVSERVCGKVCVCVCEHVFVSALIAPPKIYPPYCNLTERYHKDNFSTQTHYSIYEQ